MQKEIRECIFLFFNSRRLVSEQLPSITLQSNTKFLVIIAYNNVVKPLMTCVKIFC